MTQTKLADQINPQVMADMLSAELPSKLKFAPFATVDQTLVNNAGDTITIPSFVYIGEAEDVAEGEAVTPTKLTTKSKDVKVKKAVKAVELTDESMLSAHGNPVDETYTQLEKSLADKVDSDCVTALKTATLEHTAGAQISYDAIVDAIDKFGEEDDEVKVLFIHPNQKTIIRKSPEYIKGVEKAFMTGVIGEIAGAQVVTSNKVPFDGTNYTNFIIKEGALGIYLKRDANVEKDRDILSATDVLVANQHYVVALKNESKAVKLITIK